MSHRKPRPRIELVWWVDTFSLNAGWSQMHEIRRDCPTVYTVGFVIVEDADKIIVAASVSSDGDYGEVVGVPKRSIIGRKTIISEAPQTPKERR